MEYVIRKDMDNGGCLYVSKVNPDDSNSFSWTSHQDEAKVFNTRPIAVMMVYLRNLGWPGGAMQKPQVFERTHSTYQYKAV